MSARGNRTAVVGSGRAQEAGRLVTDKQDFNSHWQGNSFFHGASDIKMEPPIPLFDSDNVQGTLEELQTLITSNGTGFISIGSVDGYSLGTYNAGAISTPTLSDAFAAAVADPRLEAGGVILILAGKYSLRSTIQVPAGIVVLGENAGTIIVGEMLEQPMFRIKQGAGITIGGDSGSGQLELLAGAPLKSTKLVNLILADNLDGYITSGGQPIASMTSTPMVLCETGSHLTCESVKFIGRLNNGAESNRIKSLKAIGYITAGATGSSLILENCYFDGLKIGYDFSPGNGQLDFLTVNRCRARTFGTESNPGDTTHQNNCFGLMSLCNANLSNNYHVGASTSAPTVRSMFVIGSATGGTDVRISLTNNTGGPTFSTSSGLNLLVDTTGSNIKTVRSGNNWGGSVQNDWFIVVGNGSPSGSFPPGDFIGSGALDLVMTIAQSSLGQIPATVIVNPGTYVVTNPGTNSPLNLVGNKRGENYPVISLNVSGSTDGFTNAQFQVSSIKSLRFKCYTATTSNYHSVRVPIDGHITSIEDCIFTNVALTTFRFNPGTQDSDPQRQTLAVRNCHFNQDGDYTDNLCMFLASTDNILVENCVFRTAAGYVGGIGEVSGLSLTSTAVTPNIVLKNCLFTLEGGSITAASKISQFNSWFFIKDSDAKVSIENCQFLADESFTASAPIAGALTSAATYVKHIDITARDICILDSVFNGPEQTFVSSAITYALPTLSLEPIQSLFFSKSRIIGGGLPLQIAGSSAMSSNSARGMIVIEDSEFTCASSSTNLTSTLLDVDVDIDTFTINSHVNGQIIIRGNNFWQNVSSGMAQILHTGVTGSNYNGLGIVQIYAPHFEVHCTDNKIVGNLRQVGSLGSPYRNYAGLLINNFDAVTASNDAAYLCRLSGNSVKTRNYYAPEDANSAIASAWIKSANILISNNFLNMDNSVGGTLGFCGVLYLDNRKTLDVEFNAAHVNGNTFSNCIFDNGDLSSLREGYVKIASTSGAGIMVDNIFNNYTYDGSNESLVSEGTAGTINQWTIERNKNQTATFTISGTDGIIIANGNIYSASANLTAAISASSSTDTLVFSYVSALLLSNTGWQIPLSGLIPESAYIVSASANGKSNVVLDTGVFTFDLIGVGKTTVSSSNLDFTGAYVAGSTKTATLTPANTTFATKFYNSSTSRLHLRIIASILSDSTNATISFGTITVRYRW